MNKMVFESYWQADIALSAVGVAESAFIQSQTVDGDLLLLFSKVKDDLQVIHNTLKEYAIDDIQKDPTKPVAS
jgi:hypothetical protein